jgi:superfamily II DNA or RNA helicase
MLNSKPITAESSSPPAPLTSAISMLKFPFKLTKDQIEAAEAWIMNGDKGSGTGKTEIAFECAKRAYEAIVHKERTSGNNSFNILFLVPRIVLVRQSIDRLIRYGIPPEKIGAYFGAQGNT